MYEVIRFQDATLTRIVELENEETGIRHLCFDDSALVSNNNFEFMKVGQLYNCKIELFGNFSDQSEGVKCQIVKLNTMIGLRNMTQIMIDGDIFYVCAELPKGDTGNKNMYINFTRKNLIQVDDVIHEDFLR